MAFLKNFTMDMVILILMGSVKWSMSSLNSSLHALNWYPLLLPFPLPLSPVSCSLGEVDTPCRRLYSSIFRLVLSMTSLKLQSQGMAPLHQCHAST